MLYLPDEKVIQIGILQIAQKCLMDWYEINDNQI